jgi:hypothetical protein
MLKKPKSTFKEAKGFFSDELHTRSRTWKPLNSARAGLSPKIEGDVRNKKDQGRWSVSARRGHQKQEKKMTKEGGLSQEGDVRRFQESKRPEGEKVAPRRQGSVFP